MLSIYAINRLKLTENDFNSLYSQYEGAAPRYSTEVRNCVGRKVIERREAIELPPTSPGLTPMDFYFWGYAKDQVYDTEPQTMEDLKEGIYKAFEDIHSNKRLHRQLWLSVPRRQTKCIIKDGK